jgi:hypothetical protein
MNAYTVVVSYKTAIVTDGIIATSRLSYYAPNTTYYILNKMASPLTEFEKDRVANVIVNHAIAQGISAIEVKKFSPPYKKTTKKITQPPRPVKDKSTRKKSFFDFGSVFLFLF